MYRLRVYTSDGTWLTTWATDSRAIAEQETAALTVAGYIVEAECLP